VRNVLDGDEVPSINSRLRIGIERLDPIQLVANSDKSFLGSKVYGQGFVIVPEERDELLKKSRKNGERIFPYLGGEEVNSHPTQDFDRYVINFGDMTLEDAARWPDLLAIVRERVKPERDQLNDNADGRRRKQYWWQFGRATPALAYGWSDILVPPYCPPRPTDHAGKAALSLFEDTIIDRLFALNAERAAEEAAAAGRPAPVTTNGSGAAKPRGKRAKPTSTNQPSLLDEDS
jgi:hypothetical protein